MLFFDSPLDVERINRFWNPNRRFTLCDYKSKDKKDKINTNNIKIDFDKYKTIDKNTLSFYNNKKNLKIDYNENKSHYNRCHRSSYRNRAKY